MNIIYLLNLNANPINFTLCQTHSGNHQYFVWNCTVWLKEISYVDAPCNLRAKYIKKGNFFRRRFNISTIYGFSLHTCKFVENYMEDCFHHFDSLPSLDNNILILLFLHCSIWLFENSYTCKPFIIHSDFYRIIFGNILCVLWRDY